MSYRLGGSSKKDLKSNFCSCVNSTNSLFEPAKMQEQGNQIQTFWSCSSLMWDRGHEDRWTVARTVTTQGAWCYCQDTMTSSLPNKSGFFFGCNISLENFISNLQQKGFVYCQLTMHKVTWSELKLVISWDQDLPGYWGRREINLQLEMLADAVFLPSDYDQLRSTCGGTRNLPWSMWEMRDRRHEHLASYRVVKQFIYSIIKGMYTLNDAQCILGTFKIRSSIGHNKHR